MNVQQKITRPITTSDHPDPEKARRFIHDEYGFYGYDYVFVEDATWNALCHIARQQGCTVDELCSHIDLTFAHGDAPFAPAARAYVLHTIGEHTADRGELPSLLRDYLGAFAAGRAQ
jgi:predicted DNA-binding ribbon-helix-helix protein